MLAKEKEANRRLEKKGKDVEARLEDLVGAHEVTDMELREQQKINRILQKKISEL